MAATKYQVMYRFMNDTFGTPVTNNANTTYDPTFEFYTDPDHRIFLNDAVAQSEEMNKQQEMITYANSSANEKHDMLFVFDGTKKVPHQLWKDDEDGYIVRDWQQIPRSKIGNRGDYSKDFTTLNAYSPEDGGIVVCTKAVFDDYFPKKIVVTRSGEYSSAELQQKFLEACYFQLKLPNWKDHATPDSTYTPIWSHPYTRYYIGNGRYGYSHTVNGGIEIAKDYTAQIRVDDSREISKIDGYRNTYTDKELDIEYHGNPDGMYSEVFINPTDVETTTIPGHYEDSTEAPYAIKDQYKRIESSPWIINCTVGSFDAALTKARILVDMIGIENVKIIKVVPFDQFVKVK